ncbi:MAG TPA: hypothetical protein VIH82_05220 [Acidimicrobiia bacterium]
MHDVATPELVLVPTNRWIRYRAIRLAELGAGHSSDRRPMRFRRVEIQPFVQVDAHAKTTLVDVEEPTQPRTEERDHLRIAVREHHDAIPLRTLSRVQRHASSQESVFVEGTESRDPGAVALLDLALLAVLAGVAPPPRPPTTLRRGEGDVADPEGDGRLRHAELVGDLLEGSA